MLAGSCRGIFCCSHGRRQPLCHTCKKGNNYAQGHLVSLPHLGRSSKVLKCSSKQANLLFVVCVGIFFCLCLVTVQGREFKWENYTKLDRDLVFF